MNDELLIYEHRDYKLLMTIIVDFILLKIV